MMVPSDNDRIYRLLESIDAKLDSFRQETERRLAVLEERGSAQRQAELERRIRQLEEFRATVKGQSALIAGSASLVGGGLVTLILHAIGGH